MKPLKLIAMMSSVCLMVGVVGCSDKSSRGSGSSTHSSSGGSETSQSPGDVVLGFLKALKAGKIDEAYGEEYVTGEDTKMSKQMKLNETAERRRRMTEELKNSTFSLSDTKIDGDTAKVTAKISGVTGKIGDETGHFILKKINGKWKIDLSAMGQEVAEKVARAIEAISEEDDDTARKAIDSIDENTIKDLK